MKAWHFTASDRRLGYDDGRLVEPGKTLVHPGELVLCESGLHASKRLIDALQYAPGPYVWRVELGGTILRGSDKLVASARTALWGVDATDILRRFARKCAMDVIHLWDAPEVVIRYLQTGDESIRAAASAAAWAATSAATSAATRAAASAAASAATWAATWDAAWNAAATWDAAWNAASAAAWDAAAWDAARAAARDRQNRRLTALVSRGRSCQ